jgi:uncharacterized protein YwgA
MTSSPQHAWNQIAILTLLRNAHYNCEEAVDNLQIQKLSFISEIRGRDSDLKTAYYKFFRFKLGPYSPDLANDVRHLELYGFIDSETRALTDRGQYLCRYVHPEVKKSQTAQEAFAILKETCQEYRRYKSSSLVNIVYKMRVPVDGLAGKVMKVKEIPLKTDILLPDKFSSRDVQPFSPELIADIETELQMLPSQLDPNSAELRRSVFASLEAAFTR